MLLGIHAIFTRSDPYRNALARVRADAVVVQELGLPIEPGWWVTGTLEVDQSSGNANFATALRGPSGRGTLYVLAEKQAGEWRYKVLVVEVEGKPERIDLLGAGGV